MEKYSRTRQQAEYLSKCFEQKMIPRSLNFVKKAKSQILWENSKREEIFDTLYNASIELVDLQCKAKIEKYEELDKEATNLKKRLREEVTEDIYDFEMSKLKMHMARICAKGNLKKDNKLKRDAIETLEIKELRKARTPPPKKKCRRFIKKVPTEANFNTNNSDPVQNVGTDSEQEVHSEVHTSRIHGKVKNLSSIELTEAQVTVLELGPKFCPVEHDINRARYQKDLNEGFRRMKLKAKFFPDMDTRTEEEKRFYVKSSWEPPNPNHAVKTFEMLIQNNFDIWKQPTRIARNLSYSQLQALKELKANDDIDIKLDDKGGGFVVADKKDYISSVKNDLNNQENII